MAESRQIRLAATLGLEIPESVRSGDQQVAAVRVRVTAPRPRFLHPLGRREVRETLAFFSPLARYGLRAVELRQAAEADPPAITLAALRVPGVIVIYEQPEPPWLIGGRLSAQATARLEAAGALVTSSRTVTRVEWPVDTLVDFMRFDGLLHEVGHHLVQHHTGKRGARVMRTSDHERAADRFAGACRRAWEGRPT